MHIRCQNYRKFRLTSHPLIWRSVRYEQFKWETYHALVISDSSIMFGSTISKFNLDEFWHISLYPISLETGNHIIFTQ